MLNLTHNYGKNYSTITIQVYISTVHVESVVKISQSIIFAAHYTKIMSYKTNPLKSKLNDKLLQSLLILIAVLSFVTASAQNNVSVNHSTGTPNVNIPLFSVRSGSLTMPVGIVYNSSGIKVKQVEGLAGMGWNLYAGGEISREVRGLPDDCKKNLQNQDRIGWLYNSNSILINNFAPANDGNNATCQDEVDDRNYIVSNNLTITDTEPDIFYVSAPGLSTKLVFDQNHNIVAIPYADLKFAYTTDVSGAISSFTITNDKGVRYVFSETEYAKRTVTSTGNNQLFYTDFLQYQSEINYNTSWKLKSMTDINGNTILLNYYTQQEYNGAGELIKYSSDPVILIQANSTGPAIKQKLYDVETAYNSKVLTSIQFGNGNKIYDALTFKATSTQSTHVPLVYQIIGYGRTINLNYMGANSSGRHGSYNRQFLFGISEGINNYLYTFNYTGTVKDFSDDYIPLPDSSSKAIDLWGYYNGSSATDLSPQVYINPSNPALERYRYKSPGSATGNYPYTLTGSDRSPNSAYTNIGTLSKIINHGGGTTQLEYESNDYYDPISGTVEQGAGIRVKKITHNDGLGTANTIIKNFIYLNPTTGISSGKAISLPIYAFTTSNYTGGVNEQWPYSTIRSESDLSKDDHAIIYENVRESIAGAGNTLYEFSAPATNWDTANADWTPGFNYSARTDCQKTSLVVNDRNTYPFVPNTNYDFERDLVKKVTNFNENGNIVSETGYLYERSGPPVLINGFKVDYNNDLLSYGKYSILAATTKLITQETNRIFDTQTLSQVKETVNKYYYDGVTHKLPTRVQHSNSDGTLITDFTSYTKDYNITNASTSNALAIKSFQQANYNIPVEQYTQTNKNGTIRVTKGRLLIFDSFNPAPGTNFYQPSGAFKFISANGAPDFQPSSTNSGTFTYDPRYFISGKNLTYDELGMPLTSEDQNRKIQTTFVDRMIASPVMSISGASSDEVASNDFDSEIPGFRFLKTSGNPVYSSNARSGKNSLSLSAGEILAASINKSPKAENYIFSAWVNSASNGNISISVASSAGNSTYTLSFTASSGWKYYELKIPVTTISGSFTVQVSAGNPILVDDLLLYPENAEIATIGFDRVMQLKTSETNSNGVSNYYQYDNRGRIRYVYNQNKEIVLKKTYVTQNDQSALNDFSVNITSSVRKANTAIAFSASSYTSPVNEGISYVWNFGDGTLPVTTGGEVNSHTYQVAGTYTLTVTVISPIIGQKTKTITVVVDPAGLRVSYTNLTGGLQRITSIAFSQNGVQKYLFNTAQLQAGQNILQGIYTIRVIYLSGDDTTVSLNTGTGSPLSRNGSSPWNFTLDASLLNNLNFFIQ